MVNISGQQSIYDYFGVYNMSISNIERMVEALVRDEMNMVRTSEFG
jgi:hypothetical protein